MNLAFLQTLVLTLMMLIHCSLNAQIANVCRDKKNGQEKPPGPCSESTFKTTFENIKQQASRRDVATEISAFVGQMKHCKLSQDKLGYQQNKLNDLIKESQRNEYLDYVRRMTVGVQTETISAKMRNDYITAGRRIGVSESTMRSFLAILDKKNDGAEAQCTPKDMRNRLPPIRNQDSVGWCASYVVADLVSFKYGKNFSAIDVALSNIHYSNENNNSGLNYWRNLLESYIPFLKRDQEQKPSQQKGQSEANSPVPGLAENIFRAAKERGFCAEEDFPSTDFRYSTEIHNFYTAFKEIETLKCELDKYKKPQIPCFKCEKDNFIEKLLPEMTEQEFINALRRASQDQILKALSETSCKKRYFISPKDKLEHGYTHNIQGKLLGLRKINEQLSKNNIVGLRYFSNILNSNDAPFSNRHESSVIGRRWNSKTKTCEFLLRNSWGRTCNYSKAYTCEPSGYLWIPQGDLIHATFAYDYIKN